jgi:parallel beta-helix repeat protein
MKTRSLLILLTLLLGLCSPAPPPTARAAASLELYGTFHAMGVIVTLDAGDDPDGDAVASVEYRTGGSGTWRQGFLLSRISDTRFVSSLFWLEPSTAYDVRITFSDPDGSLHGVTVESSASTRAEIVIPAPTHSYYVAHDGGGTACSEATPCSLTEGLSQAQPGEEVVLRDGVYHQGDISFPRSGTSGAPIVIRGYDGETAVLDGADPTTFTWTAQGGGGYRTTVNVADTHLVLSDGQRLFPYSSLADLQALHWSVPGFYADGTTLDIHLAGNANPNDATMVVSRHNNAFYVEQNFIYLVNLTFRHYGQASCAKAIYFNDASDNLVQGCTFANNDLGIGIKRDSHRNVIQDNEFYDTIFDWPWNGVKAAGGLEDGGVVFYSNPFSGRGNVIRRNIFHDDFDGFGACPSSIDAVMTNETDVYENTIYNMGDDGMETDGQCSNVRIWSNTFHDVLMGISLAPVYDGPVYAIRNLIYRTGVGNNDYTGSPFKFNSGLGHSGPMYLFHNTADAALPGNNGIYIKAPGTWEMIYARNNVWAGTDYALNNYNETQPIDLDYDDLYTTNPDEFVYWGSGPDRHMHDLVTFQTLTGQEPHGLDVEPGFTDATTADYTLAPTSDLINSGVLIPGINDDYVGTAPDIGAFEYQGYGFTLIPAPPSRAIAPGAVATYTIRVQPIGGFTHTVTLIAASPSPSLTLSLTTTTVAQSSQATLTITDTHTGTTLLPGLWYTIPITATGGGLTQTTSVGLLVGGARVYLPAILRDYP